MSQVILDARKKMREQQQERTIKRVQELKRYIVAKKMYKNKLKRIFIKWREARIKRNKEAQFLKILVLNRINGLDEYGPGRIISEMIPYG